MQYHLHPEAKFLQGGYADRGKTMRRHVYATVVSLIGKEANRWEEQLYLGMEAEAQVEYGLTPAENEYLRRRLEVISKVMGGRRLAHAIGVSRRHLSNLLRGKGVVPTSAGTLPK